jgi:hypothetical protein
MEREILMKKFWKGLLTAILAGLPFAATAQFDAQQTWCTGSCVAGTGNAIVLNIKGITTLGDLVGVPLRFIPANANTAAVTIAVGSTAPQPLLKIGANGLIALIGGELPIGPPSPAETVIYDGAEYVLQTSSAPLVTLSAPRSYYVNASTGSDANNCLTSGLPCLTIQHAISLINALNMNGYNVTINLASGTYAPFVAGPLNGSGTVQIIGNTTTPSTVVISAITGEAAYFSAPGWTLAGVTVSSAANGSAPHLGCGVRATGGAVVTLYDISFGAASFAQVEAEFGSGIVFLGVLNGTPSAFVNIVGSAPAFMYAIDASIATGGTNLTLIGTPTYSSTSFGFAYATQLGVITEAFNSVTGSATGKYYNATLNAIISGVSTYPGSVAGTTATGGQAN